MSETITVSPDEFAKAMKKLIDTYGDHAFQIAEETAKSTARKGASALKRSAPTGGSYARGWSHKALRFGVLSYTEIIYNRTDYQLTHLLEKPHRTGKYKKGSYPKKKNYTGTIARVESEYGTKFYEGVIEKL